MANLLDPIKIGPMEVTNRIVAGPMMSYTDVDGYVTQKALDLYEERAAGGSGLVHVEASAVRKDGRPFEQFGLWHDRFLPGLEKLAKSIHRGGAKASMQLLHSGRQSSAALNKVQVLAPSAKTPPWAQQKPKVMSTEECENIIDAYAAAALRCKQAGFDCILFHGTHGFLPQQFMSPFTNVDRTDRFAGPTGFVTELVKKTRAAVGPGMAITFRIPGSEHLGDRGLTTKMMAEVIAPALVDAGVDGLDVTAGMWLRFDVIIPSIYYPNACLVPYAEIIKKAVSVPVAGGGRVNSFKVAQELVDSDRLDLVFLGRQIFADPQFAKKSLEGRPDEIKKCLACDGCMTPTLPLAGPICTVNPLLGREKTFPMTPVAKSKKVLVVGGGVGGMEAARVAALRGHEVTLCEQTSRLGGQVNLAVAIRHVQTNELSRYAKQISRWLKEQKNIKIEMDKTVTLETIKEMRPDAVLVATGSSPLIPEVPGIDKPIVMTKDDALRNHSKIGNRVVILGGKRSAEIGVSYRKEGKEVTILSEEGTDLIGAAPYIKGFRIYALGRMIFHSGATILPDVKIEEITDSGVKYQDQDGNAHSIDADTVVLALGREPNAGLVEELGPFVIGELDSELIEIGDCVTPLDQLSAIHDGFFAAYGIGDPEGRIRAQLAKNEREAGLQTVIPAPGIDLATDIPLVMGMPPMDPGEDLKSDWDPNSPVYEEILAPHPQAD